MTTTNTHQVLHWLAAALIWANEIIFPFNLWIVSAAPVTSSTGYKISPTITSIAYAFSEPFWQFLLSNLPLPAWMPFPSARALQTFAAVHAASGVLAAERLSKWLEDDPTTRRLQPEEDPALRDAKGHALSSINPRMKAPSPTTVVYALYLIPVQTAAILNATVLIWAQQLQDPGLEIFTGGLALGVDAVVLYVAFSVCSNYFWCKTTSRAWRFRSGKYLGSQVLNLCILLALRLGVRRVLGLRLTPGLDIL